MTGSQSRREHPWSMRIAVEEVPQTGRRVVLVADEGTRTAIARIAQVRDLQRLEATFDLTRHGDGLRVVGHVSAAVGQTCVVTLDPIENDLEEPIDLVFASEAPPLADDAAGDIEVTAADPPEPLVNGGVDLGAIATEFLMLAIYPYPRKPGAVFEPPAAGGDAGHAFAPLAALKKRQQGGHDR